MLIEASSFKLCIDLVQQLENFGFIAEEIRLNYKGSRRYFEDKKSSSASIKFANLATLKSTFLSNYNHILNTGKNPFTENQGNAFVFTIPAHQNGVPLQQYPVTDFGTDSIKNIFHLGKYAVIRGIKLKCDGLGFDTKFNCVNIHKDTFKITTNTAFNHNRKTQRLNQASVLEKTLTNIISQYRTINDKFFNLYLLNKDVNLEYLDFSADGPSGNTYKLYKMHFPIIKRPLNAGLSLDVIKPMVLLKQSIPAQPTCGPCCGGSTLIGPCTDANAVYIGSTTIESC